MSSVSDRQQGWDKILSMKRSDWDRLSVSAKRQHALVAEKMVARGQIDSYADLGLSDQYIHDIHMAYALDRKMQKRFTEEAARKHAEARNGSIRRDDMTILKDCIAHLECELEKLKIRARRNDSDIFCVRQVNKDLREENDDLIVENRKLRSLIELMGKTQ